MSKMSLILRVRGSLLDRIEVGYLILSLKPYNWII